MDLNFLTLTEASQLIARREVSPVEITRACLERIEQVDTKLNSFITVTPELALEQAAEAEAALRTGPPVSPLHGLPLALKDLFNTRGVRTTAGSKFFMDFVPGEDAVVVQKLREAGMVLLGKLNLHEIALGLTNVNPHFGACRNPWDLERVSGGSSGGAGAALAAGLCPGALGSDTGGSIRVPAALCGVVGLKPTFGRTSLRGVFPLSWNLDHAGPMARTVRDAALLLQATAGYDPIDPYSADRPVDDYLANLEGGVGGMRIALAAGEYFTDCDPQVLAAVRDAAQVFSALGAQVEDAPIPGAREAALANSLMVVSDAAAFHRQRLESRPQDFGEDVRQRLQLGAAYTAVEYILARHTQAQMRRQLEVFFQEFDLFLTPATPVTAPPVSGPDAIEQARTLTRFTSMFNLTGLPALSLPCGFSSAGLPVGLQIAARPWAEAELLRAAHAYEQATGWHLRRPVV